MYCLRFPGLSPQNFPPHFLVMGWGYTPDGVWHVQIILRITGGWTSLEEEVEERHAPCLFKTSFPYIEKKSIRIVDATYSTIILSYPTRHTFLVTIKNNVCRMMKYILLSQLQKCDTARCIFRIIIDGRPINKLHYFVTSNAQHTFVVTIKSLYHGNPNFHFCIAAKCWRIFLWSFLIFTSAK